ncbi:MAG: class I SAM-dependent methyltransferase [Pseudomonadota bacterium]
MSFSKDWLDLRLPADLAARNDTLAARLGAHFAGRSGLRVLDLGAGSGNNMRATAAWLPKGQTWCLVDQDADLLAAAPRPQDVQVETRVADLAADIESLLRPAPDLVTASAFFDLCGAAWLSRFADALAQTGAALYAVLSYDGREEWRPAHPADQEVLTAFHRDQRRDKGFGPALGPEAHDRLITLLQTRGYTVQEGPSDWHLAPPRDAALIAALAEGSAAAVAPDLGERASDWRAARQIASDVMIGHRDLLALPPR